MIARAMRDRLVAAVLVALVGIGAFAAGAVAASLTIQSGAESGKGATESGTAITWWAQTDVDLEQIPSPAPATANASAATPTLLIGGNTSYSVGTVTANDSAIRWDFQMRAPPVLTEFEITVSVLNLSAAGPTILTVYLETPAAPSSGTVLISLFLDNGAGVTGFRSASQLSQQCMAFGSCP